MSNKKDSLADNGYYYYTGNFTQDDVRPVIEWIMEMNLRDTNSRPKVLTLVISSYGGEVDMAFALIDTMRGSAIPVRTVGLGTIMSCGLIAFMAGTTRIITPNTNILSHQFSGMSYGKEHELFARIKGFEHTQEKIMRHYKQCTNMKKKDIIKYLLPPEDMYITAEEAVEFGIADKVALKY